MTTMILAALVQAALAFGGIPFGATEQEVRQKGGANIVEETLGDGSRALVVTERIAGREAKRKWVIRDNLFVEGVLLFSFKSDQGACQNLQQTALSSIESNYGAQPRLDKRTDSGPRGMQSELWIVTLAQGARIEQRMLYVPLIGDCTISGRYFAPAEGSSAF
jgi:hypothetical protein